MKYCEEIRSLGTWGLVDTKYDRKVWAPFTLFLLSWMSLMLHVIYIKLYSLYMFMIIYDNLWCFLSFVLSQDFGTQTEVPLSGTHASAVAAALDVLRPESVLIFVCPNAGESVAWCNGWTTWEGYGKVGMLERWCIDSVAFDWNQNQKSRGICQRLFGSHQGPYLEWNILCPKLQRL